MTDPELVDDFIEFLNKQLRFGSSKAPLLHAMIDDYTFYETEKEKIVAGLHKLGLIKYHGGNATIDLEKLHL